MNIELRDYFAAKALQGIMSRPLSELAEGAKNQEKSVDQYIVDVVYRISESMLKRREGESVEPEVLIEDLCNLRVLDLTVRDTHSLINADVKTMRELCELSQLDLIRRVPNVGPASARAIAFAVKKAGYKLKGEE